MNARPIHILHVVIALDPGGLENGIVNMASHLDPSRFRLSILCLERAGEFAGRLPKNTAMVVLNKPPGISISTALKLRKALRNLNPDVIHTHGLGPLIYTVAATRFYNSPPPILHGEHRELMPHEQTRFKLLLRRVLFRRCAAVHTVSEALRQHFLKFAFPNNRLIAIPNGVDSNRFRPADKSETRRRLDLPEDATILGMIANFRPEKGHIRLIQGFNQIAGEFPNLQLLLVGAGPMAEQIKTEAKSSPFAGRIRFAGHQPEPLPWYQAMNLLIIPSSAEGLSNAALEAMACEIPVLASKACGNNDAIQHLKTGFIFDLDTPNAIAQALKTTLRAPEQLSAMGKTARADMLHFFNIDNMRNQYAEEYTAVHAENPRYPG